MAAAAPNCGDKVNHVILAPCLPARRACSHPGHAGGAAISVCDLCALDTSFWHAIGNNVVRIGDFARPALPRWPARNGNLPQIAAQGAWPRFLTLLCKQCSDWEIKLLHLRQSPHGAPTRFTPTAQQQQLMQNYPVITCTCLRTLTAYDIAFPAPPPAPAMPNVVATPAIPGYRHCRPHRQAEWVVMDNNAQQNKAWLESIDRIEGSRDTALASLSTKRRRDRQGTYRACRCGTSIDNKTIPGLLPAVFPAGVGANLPAVPHVAMCMSCEGIWHFQNPPIGTFRDFRPERNTLPGLSAGM